QATICAPPGPLAEPARRAGIEVVPTEPWLEGTGAERGELWRTVAAHDVAVVHWEQGVMEAFGPALESCGRAALALHQSPRALTRWFGETTVATARSVLEQAVAEERAVALVRGAAHRRKVAEAFEVPEAGLRVLPASVDARALPFEPAAGEPRELLAMTRLSAEKAAVVGLAIQLTAARLAAGGACRLTVAGEGTWRDEAIGLCEERLPAASWRIEPAPRDPVGRLAAADLIVAQGVTTLEAAALGRPVVVARAAAEEGGVVLTPGRYDEAARDPFGEPRLTTDPDRLWREAAAVDRDDLRGLRRLVERGNSIEAASRALDGALAATGRRGLRGLLRRAFSQP
ncbi:MAG TPA: hypothetical protein VEQ41_06535, partial [Solirubrobacterales bacterium]|nr:hypothetical protein [Solirubrobacterales bacterium]